jgi:hypothetical protein
VPGDPHAKIRALGERANAALKTWKLLAGLHCCPQRATAYLAGASGGEEFVDSLPRSGLFHRSGSMAICRRAFAVLPGSASPGGSLDPAETAALDRAPILRALAATLAARRPRHQGACRTIRPVGRWLLLRLVQRRLTAGERRQPSPQRLGHAVLLAGIHRVHVESISTQIEHKIE